ncbi:MAG: hypothetical protein JO352_27865 [Chloroflexi bacterium]|nr:hypothetical protein [Chloroflexota bacterium]
MSRLVAVLVGAAVALALLAPLASADPLTGAVDTPPSPASASRISAADPLNGGFLVLNMHGMLFHPDTTDIGEDLNYARWLGGGIVRVFATDSSGSHAWDGARVGARIAEIAPMLRAAHLRLIVALVNNHAAVPGESPGSVGWMDNYVQLLLPFYTTNWRGAYYTFVHDLISTVEISNDQDVIYAWELGNELHTPRQPDALIPFISQDAAYVRQLDPVTPIFPGTMGANHVEPGNPSSSIARWLYCEAPVDAYTLHAYDWVSRQRPGDMPIDWDLDNIVSQPCDNGRRLPVIVEELGTSRALPGVYTADDEAGRLQQEQRQIAFVRGNPQVIGWGVWNAESPRLVDRTFVDTRRGLTSYGSSQQGGGSCYDPRPDPAPGVRCQLEQVLRGSHFARVAATNTWTASPGNTSTDPLQGQVDPLSGGDLGASTLTLNGWLVDPDASGSTGIDGLDVYQGSDPTTATLLTGAQLGLTRSDPASIVANPDWARPGFSINLPLDNLPAGPTTLTLAARTHNRGTWLSSLAVVVPNLGSILPPVIAVASAPTPSVATLPAASFRAEVESPQPNDQVSRSFVVQVLAQGADHVDIYLEPDRDFGGHLVGSATVPIGVAANNPVKILVNAPPEGHTLYVHVGSSVSGQQQVLTVPIVVHS